jgi:hypothetical protein
MLSHSIGADGVVRGVLMNESSQYSLVSVIVKLGESTGKEQNLVTRCRYK